MLKHTHPSYVQTFPNVLYPSWKMKLLQKKKEIEYAPQTFLGITKLNSFSKQPCIFTLKLCVTDGVLSGNVTKTLEK